jgi:hypothetical protein
MIPKPEALLKGTKKMREAETNAILNIHLLRLLLQLLQLLNQCIQVIICDLVELLDCDVRGSGCCYVRL